MDEAKKQLYKKCLKKWGHLQNRVENCALVLFEEMSELQISIIKKIRYSYSTNQYQFGLEQLDTDIIEELADVQIMLEQMIVFYGEEKVNAVMQEKLKRLEKLMQKD